MSLYCDPCAKAFKELKALIESCPDVKINFIFPLYGDAATQKVINTLCYLNAEKDTGAILNILAEWYLMPKQLRKTFFTKHIIPESYNQARQTGEKNQQLFENSKIAATPTVFINGYRFPI